MNHRTVFAANPLDYTRSSRYIQTPGCPDGYLAVISTCLLPVRNNCLFNWLLQCLRLASIPGAYVFVGNVVFTTLSLVN